jgi:SH3 domain-containing protein
MCRLREARVRAAPDDSSEQVTQALAGESLTVEERRIGWARIRTALGRGWIREEALRACAHRLPPARSTRPSRRGSAGAAAIQIDEAHARVGDLV